jgi:hypothetical protein
MRISIDEFSRMVVYDNGKILFEKGRDFDRIGTFEEGKYFYEYFDRIEFFNLPDVKNARKENLFRKDCYFLRYTDPVFTWERKQALYIHVSCIEFEDLGEHVAVEHDGEKDFHHYYRLHFPDGFRYKHRNYERMNVSDDWKLPDGATWDHGQNCYTPVDKEDWNRNKQIAEKHGVPFEPYNMIHEWTSEKYGYDVVFPTDKFTRIEYDKARQDRERIADLMNEVLGKYTVSSYKVAELLEKLTIEIK